MARLDRARTRSERGEERERGLEPRVTGGAIAERRLDRGAISGLARIFADPEDPIKLDEFRQRKADRLALSS